MGGTFGDRQRPGIGVLPWKKGAHCALETDVTDTKDKTRTKEAS